METESARGASAPRHEPAAGRPTTRVALAEHVAAGLAPILRGDGVAAALALLNARTRYRFTGLYRVAPPLLHNVSLYDRENPALDASGGTDSLADTYCAVVVATGGPFETPDAAADARLRAHAARDTVLSYVGVPIRGPDGRVRGTLCHFDGRPRLMPEGEAALLARVAALLADQWLASLPDVPAAG